jgi:hypothetical protein
MQLSRSAAFAIGICVLAVGTALGIAMSSWTGRAPLGGTHSIPVYISETKAGPSSELANGMGFAPILQTDLPAVVSITSSRLVKVPQVPFFNDPFFQQFFGGQMPRTPQQQRERGLGSGVFVSCGVIDQAAHGPPIATVRFTSNQLEDRPYYYSYYSLAITSMGSASYQSLPNSNRRTGESYMMGLALSAATRARIFQVGRRLHLLCGEFQTTCPDSWTKSLTFTGGPIQHEILDTTGISARLEFGWRLEAACRQSRRTDATTIEAGTGDVQAGAPYCQQPHLIRQFPKLPEKEHAGGSLEHASRNAYQGSALPS